MSKPSEFLGKLSNTVQRYYADNITAATSADTRQRRIDKAIALFRAGKKGDDARSSGRIGRRSAVGP